MRPSELSVAGGLHGIGRRLKRELRMSRILVGIILFSLFPAHLFAQEKVVDGFSVNFGMISWEQMERGMTEKPATHTEEYHYGIAREMSKMHRGGKKGTYHILVVIDDKKTGRRIDKADVRVTFIGRRGPETIKLQPMAMDGFAGFGRFVRLRQEGPYVFSVSFRFSDKKEFRQVRYTVQ